MRVVVGGGTGGQQGHQMVGNNILMGGGGNNSAPSSGGGMIDPRQQQAHVALYWNAVQASNNQGQQQQQQVHQQHPMMAMASAGGGGGGTHSQATNNPPSNNQQGGAGGGSTVVVASNSDQATQLLQQQQNLIVQLQRQIQQSQQQQQVAVVGGGQQPNFNETVHNMSPQGQSQIIQMGQQMQGVGAAGGGQVMMINNNMSNHPQSAVGNNMTFSQPQQLQNFPPALQNVVQNGSLGQSYGSQQIMTQQQLQQQAQQLLNMSGSINSPNISGATAQGQQQTNSGTSSMGLMNPSQLQIQGGTMRQRSATNMSTTPPIQQNNDRITQPTPTTASSVQPSSGSNNNNITAQQQAPAPLQQGQHQGQLQRKHQALLQQMLQLQNLPQLPPGQQPPQDSSIAILGTVGQSAPSPGQAAQPSIDMAAGNSSSVYDCALPSALEPDPIAPGHVMPGRGTGGGGGGGGPVPPPSSSSGGGGGGRRRGGNNNGKENGKQNYLEGHFEGGWQSNADLPERRRIIFSIIKVIERMRPDANQLSQNRLPLMAKKLEEHLYRSSETREDYTDPASLKRRLHVIAKGVGTLAGDPTVADLEDAVGRDPPVPMVARSSSSSTQRPLRHIGSSQNNPQEQQLSQVLDPQQQMILQQMQLQEQQANIRAQQLRRQQQSNGVQNTSGVASATVQNATASRLPRDSAAANREDNEDPRLSEKKKVVLQQQRRLLLLRHASKCDGGPTCRTKFCPQMVTLWKHMKKCRDKTCRIPHCLSSRCVLNHYRLCKSEGKTATCTICAPVLRLIRQGDEALGSADGIDPLDETSGGSSGDDGIDPLDGPIGLTDGMDTPTEAGAAAPAQQLPSNGDPLTAFLPVGPSSFSANSSTQSEGGGRSQSQDRQPNCNDAPQNLQEDLQRKQLLLQQVHQQQGDLFGSSQILQQQLLSASNPEQAQQLAEQQSILQQLNQQCGQQKSLLESEIQHQSLVIEQQQHGDAQAIAPASAGAAIVSNKRSSDIITSTDGQQKEEGDESSRPNKIAKRDEGDKKSDSVDKDDGRTTSTHADFDAQKYLPLVKKLMDHEHGWVFNDPVDPAELGIPEYFDVVKRPMDLTLVMNNVKGGVYKDATSFERDTKLVFENAILFNGRDSEVGGMAKDLLDMFVEDLKSV